MAKVLYYGRTDLERFKKYLSLYKKHIEEEKLTTLTRLEYLKTPKRIRQRRLKRYLKILKCVNTLIELNE